MDSPASLWVIASDFAVQLCTSPQLYVDPYENIIFPRILMTGVILLRRGRNICELDYEENCLDLFKTARYVLNVYQEIHLGILNNKFN